jgi:hypothetical protein
MSMVASSNLGWIEIYFINFIWNTFGRVYSWGLERLSNSTQLQKDLHEERMVYVFKKIYWESNNLILIEIFDYSSLDHVLHNIVDKPIIWNISFYIANQSFIRIATNFFFIWVNAETNSHFRNVKIKILDL